MSSLYIRPATLALVISTAYVIIYALSYAGVNIPIVRQVLGLALIFMPGYFAARLLGLRGVESLLISVGLALSLVMFAGAATNFIYPALGVSKPLVGPPVVATTLMLTAILVLIHYLKNSREYIQINKIGEITTPGTLSLLTMPLWTAFGVYLLMAHGNNLILMAQTAFFAVLPILVALDKIPQRLYPAALWSMALSLLLQNSLPTIYPRLTDGKFEHAIVKVNDGVWNPDLGHLLNAMLSVTILLPTLSEVVGLSVNWLYKLVIPLIYSVVPVVLYYAYKRLVNAEIAFLSSYFFMSSYIFYTWAGLTIKTATSMLFFAMILLLVASYEAVDKLRRTIMTIVFGISIAVSHYGMGYIFMFYTVATLIIVAAITRLREAPKTLTLIFAIAYITFTVLWYSQMASGVIYKSMVTLVSAYLNYVLNWRFLPSGTYITEILTKPISQSLEILKALSALFVGLAVLMTIVLIIRRHRTNHEFNALAIGSIPVGASVFFGGLSTVATPDRIFHIVTAVLSPYAVLAVITFVSLLKRGAAKIGLAIAAVLLAIYLLTNVGFTAELLREFPGASLPLSISRIESGGTLLEREYLYRTYVPHCDVVTAHWLSKYSGDKKVYADAFGRAILTLPTYGAEVDSNPIALIPRDLNIDGYLYLRKLNYVDRIIVTAGFPLFLPRYFYLNVTLLINKIYDNGCSAIYIR
ncbi:MAG: DUF2206 domain-containing protein [Pyrobaculum sp.]